MLKKIKENIINSLLKNEKVFNAVIKLYNNSSNIYNGHNNFEEYLISNYKYYRDNQDVNNYLFNKYQTYREIMEHYNVVLKEKLDMDAK